VRIHSNGVGFPVPSRRVVDIDTEDDWDRAETIYNYIYGRGKYD
jgi:CMP-N-acetylneuraminic acid synthetase